MRKIFAAALGSLLFALQALSTKVIWTYYWVAHESEESGSGAKDTNLLTCKGAVIAKVTKHYAERVRMEGTGRLQDGRMVNLDCDCGSSFKCFAEIKDTKKYYWGIGENDNALVPFVSVASNMYTVGTILKITELVGKVMPGTGGQKHNGCVRVDDESWSFDGNQLDFLAGK